MIVVFIFLGRWRATFVVVFTIPISLLAALVYLLCYGRDAERHLDEFALDIDRYGRR